MPHLSVLDGWQNQGWHLIRKEGLLIWAGVPPAAQSDQVRLLVLWAQPAWAGVGTAAASQQQQQTGLLHS